MAISLCLAKRLGRGDTGAAKVVTVQNVLLLIIGIVNFLMSYPDVGKWQVGIAVLGVCAGLSAWRGLTMESDEVHVVRGWADHSWFYGFRSRKSMLITGLILSAVASVLWIAIAVHIIVIDGAGIGAWQVPLPPHSIPVQEPRVHGLGGRVL